MPLRRLLLVLLLDLDLLCHHARSSHNDPIGSTTNSTAPNSSPADSSTIIANAPTSSAASGNTPNSSPRNSSATSGSPTSSHGLSLRLRRGFSLRCASRRTLAGQDVNQVIFTQLASDLHLALSLLLFHLQLRRRLPLALVGSGNLSLQLGNAIRLRIRAAQGRHGGRRCCCSRRNCGGGGGISHLGARREGEKAGREITTTVL